MTLGQDMRTSMTALRDALRAEMGAGNLLSAVKEVQIGLHAEDRSYQPSGVYLMPVKLRIDDSETHVWDYNLRVRLIMLNRGHRADASDSSPQTFVLTDIVAGVLETIQNTRDLGGGVWLEPGDERESTETDFTLAPLQGGGLVLRAETHVTLHHEVTSLV